MARQTFRADVADLRDGEFRLVDAKDTKILLLRHEGEVRAFSGTCPHYGAPLDQGLICGHKLVCPWHKAGFDIRDGALLEPPALEGLARYPVAIEGDAAVITLEPQPAVVQDGIKNAEEVDDAEGIFGIVGTGAAGMAAARSLRDQGFAGRIVMIGHEAGTPYDRPALSKSVPSGALAPEDASLKSSFYQDNAIDFRRLEVETIDVANRRVMFRNGSGLNCDALLIASGCVPVRLDVPGANLGNVLVLRSQEDAQHLNDAANAGGRVVIVGSSFIGLEVSTGLAQRGRKVDVVSPDSVPFARQFGVRVGRALLAQHEKNGVTFHRDMHVERLEGEGDVQAVVLKNGTRLDADFVLVAIGVTPSAGMLRGGTRQRDGSVEVDEYLRIADEVYAAGDIAAFPDPRSGKRVRIEHWRLAEQLGRTAAMNMLGKKQKFTAVPFFWTEQCGQRIDYAGHAPAWDQVLVHGEPERLDYIAYYIQDGKILAASACQRDRQMIAFMHLLETGRLPTPDTLRAEDIDLTRLLN